MSSLNALEEAIEVCFATAETCFEIASTDGTPVPEATAVDIAARAAIISMLAVNSVINELWRYHKSEKIPFAFNLDLMTSLNALETEIVGGAASLTAYSKGALNVLRAYVRAGPPIVSCTNLCKRTCITSARACTSAAKACTMAATGPKASNTVAKAAASTAAKAARMAVVAAEALNRRSLGKKDWTKKEYGVDPLSMSRQASKVLMCVCKRWMRKGNVAASLGLSRQASKVANWIRTKVHGPLWESDEIIDQPDPEETSSKSDSRSIPTKSIDATVNIVA